MLRSLVGSEMCIRDRYQRRVRGCVMLIMAHAPRVVVVGAGVAGLSCSLSVLEHQPEAQVWLLDKAGHVFGCNSAKASSGISAAVREDQLERFREDTLTSGRGLSNPDLVKVLVEHSARAMEFLDRSGVVLSSISQLGGHSEPRTYRPGCQSHGNVGRHMVDRLTSRLSEFGDRLTILRGATVTRLVQEERRVVGVWYKDSACSLDKQLRAQAVVLTTGGFGACGTLVAEYGKPIVQGLATTNSSTTTGDGLELGIQVGAGLTQMDCIQLHPTGIVDPADPHNKSKKLAGEMFRGYGGLLCNGEGRRFVNELETRDVVTAAMFEHCTEHCLPAHAIEEPNSADSTLIAKPAAPTAWLILNQAVADQVYSNS
eukprot:TRINITY_DN5089_c0_g1_i1.p1 TRINITY_DN5089_c0_g1~~TRINITY_DN5089_c0_g1_i1.p1  ORF type:complete len:413 (-),score=79.64 TRINITY_DN5089_c0_g1_i1:198-1310(-)